MKSLLMKISWMKIVIYSVVIVSISLAYQWIARNILSENVLNEFFYKIIFVDFDEITAIWSAQYTIGLISIGIVSLIVGNINTKKYGYTITESIMIDRSKFKLKYWDNVVLIIVLALIGMYFVTHKSLEGITLLFIINVILVLLILEESLKIIINSNEYKVDKIRNHIVDNVKEYIKTDYCENEEKSKYEDENAKKLKSDNNIIKILEKIYSHCIESLNSNDTVNLIRNIELYIDLMNKKFYKEDTKSFNEQQNKLIETLKAHVYSICRYMIKNNNIKELQIMIEKILDNKEYIYDSDIILGNIIVILADNINYMKELESIEEYGFYEYIVGVIKNDVNEKTNNGEGDYLDEKTKIILEKIYTNTSDLIKAGKINQSNKNLDLYLKLLNKKNYSKSKDLEEVNFNAKIGKLKSIIKKYIVELCKVLNENDDIQNIKETIDKIVNEKDEILLSEIITREILINVVDSVKYINHIRILKYYDLYKYINKLNICKESRIELLERYYFNLKENVLISGKEKIEATNEFIEFISQEYSYAIMRLSNNSIDCNDAKYEISMKVTLFIGRESMLNNYENDLTELVYNLNKHCRILDEREYYSYNIGDKSCIYKLNELFTVLSVYGYYLVQVEDSINTEFKSKLIKILNSYKKDQSTNKYSLTEIIANSRGEYIYYFDWVYNLMNNLSWEFLQINTLKDTKIEKSIIEFFVYYGTVFIDSMNSYIYMHDIEYFKNMYNLKIYLDYFDSNGEIKDKEAVMRFCEINGIEYKKEYKGKVLYNYLIEKYKIKNI